MSDETPEAIYARIRARRLASETAQQAAAGARAAKPAARAAAAAAGEPTSRATSPGTGSADTRAADRAADQAHPASPARPTVARTDEPRGAPIQVHELFDLPPGSGDPDPASRRRDDADDQFPRSATMRLALRHPGLLLAAGIPAAMLIARSPATRRLLMSAARFGTQPLVWQLASASVRAGEQLGRAQRHAAQGRDRPGPADGLTSDTDPPPVSATSSRRAPRG